MNVTVEKKRKKRSYAFLQSGDWFDALCTEGYTPLDRNPEIVAGCRVIAQTISSMTIYLMANTERGDVRIVNELSRAVDIEPCKTMTRSTWMDAIVMNLLLYGSGNSIVVPHTRAGYLDDLEPIAAGRVSFTQSGDGYRVLIDGMPYAPENLLHFVNNPDKNYPWKGQGLTVAMEDVARNLRQAAETERGFMSSKWKPGLIIKADAMSEDFATPEGRRKLLNNYVSTNEAGEPWIIPADQLSVEQVKPLSLADLAISDVVQLDKRTVASILGVPPFLLGIGEYSATAWNAFVNNTIRPIAREIEQELTRKILLSPKMYWRFNIASLYSYDLKTTADVYSNLYIRGIVTGNEVRDKIGMEPRDGLDELVILENFVPIDRIGDQKKLIQPEEK